MNLTPIAAIAAALTVWAASAAPADAQTLGMATTQVGGFQYTTSAALGKVLDAKTDVKARVQSFSSGNQFLPLIDSGEMDVALVLGTEAAFAFKGSNWFDGQPQPELRAVAALVPNLTGYFVREDSDIKSVADLKGRKVSVGFTAQPVAALLSQAVLATAGLTEADLDGVSVPHVKNSADDFVRGNVEAYYFAVLAGKNAEVSAQVDGTRLLPIDASDSAIAAACEIAPLCAAVELEPDANITGVEVPTETLGAMYLLVAGKHVSDEAITEILTVLADDQADLIEASQNFREYDPTNMHREAGIPYHPAALAFYEMRGMN